MKIRIADIVFLTIIALLVIAYVDSCQVKRHALSEVAELAKGDSAKTVALSHWTDRNNKEHGKAEQNNLSRDVAEAFYHGELDSMARLLGIKSKQILEYKMLAVTTKGSITPNITYTSADSDTVSSFGINYSTNWLDVAGTGTIYKNRIKDLKLDYLHRDTVKYVVYTKKGLFSPSKSFVDISLADSNSRLAGIRQIVITQKPKRWGFGFDVGYGLSLLQDHTVRLGWHAGVSINYDVMQW